MGACAAPEIFTCRQIITGRRASIAGVKISSRVAAAAVVLSAAGLMLWRSKDTSAAPEVAIAPQGQRPRVDLVFVLDTTGSMGGLIEGAKQKIWDIARRAQEGQPSPEVRVGLVAYRDRTDVYVTKVVDLTSDLDTVYARLTELTAQGGGDQPEHVLAGLRDGVERMRWSSDPNAVKLVYLVGDAPPHFDYDDGITLDGVLSRAKERGVNISAIRCGQDASTLSAWTQIAQRSNGEVATIEQSGGVVAVTTPYDAELARLNAELARTEIRWGSDRERKEAAASVARGLAAPAAVQADRAAFFSAHAASKAGPAKQDLAAGGADVRTLDEGLLPDDMQRMSADERARHVEAKKRERESVLAQIKEQQGKRDAYLKTSAPKPSATAFDGKVYDSLRKAGASKGVVF